MKFLVAQLGARMHYAVPRILDSTGLLERFYTDICAAKGWPRALCLIPEPVCPSSLRRFRGRIPSGVHRSRITSFPGFGLRYARRRLSAAAPDAVQLWGGRVFCERIVRRGFGAADAVYAFNTAALELLKFARSEGRFAVLEQTIAPAIFEDALLAEERARFPRWESPASTDARRAELRERERAEWDAADRIFCGSPFVRDAIRACGGPPDRCVVVPYGVDCAVSTRPRIPLSGRPLRVLSVGAVGLRKGTPYVLDAARALRGRAEFRLTGPISASPEVIEGVRHFVEITGPVPRKRIADHYSWADVFLLPSLCEGSATACYEALAHGVPVITTPNAGSVVRDRVEGFIVPIRDSQSIINALETLATTPGLLAEMSTRASDRSRDFTVSAYAARFLRALRV